jgi:hypothetical protein
LATKKSHYLVGDSNKEYEFEHVTATNRKEAVRLYLEMQGVDSTEIAYNPMQVGVVLESDITYFDVQPSTDFAIVEKK